MDEINAVVVIHPKNFLSFINIIRVRISMDSKKILIIDDNPNVCETMLLLLESIGMQAYAATNATDGVCKAFEIEPDLILLDILMSDYSGWTVLDQIRSDPHMCHTPVAVFSALMDSAAHVRESEQQVDGYLPKPFRMQELRELIYKTTRDSATSLS